jgi:hypothetical protein
MVFAWLGTPDTTGTVPMPWSKAGTVAGPRPGGLLIALIQEESNGYCEIRYRATTSTDWVQATTNAACSSNITGPLVEGTLDLPAELGGVPLSSLPADIHTAAIEIGTNNGGSLSQALQTPACVTCNANLDATETFATHRARLLVGRVQAQ